MCRAAQGRIGRSRASRAGIGLARRIVAVEVVRGGRVRRVQRNAVLAVLSAVVKKILAGARGTIPETYVRPRFGPVIGDLIGAPRPDGQERNQKRSR